MDVSHELKVADEVFLVMADMHRAHPEASDFSVREILDHANQMRLTPELRPGVEIHIRQHCVANLPPNPGRYRMLFATGKARRRLLEPSDKVNEGRDGKIFPNVEDIEPRFRPLEEWAKSRFDSKRDTKSILRKLADLRGSGQGLWREGGDAFVDAVRKDWQ